MDAVSSIASKSHHPLKTNTRMPQRGLPPHPLFFFLTLQLPNCLHNAQIQEEPQKRDLCMESFGSYTPHGGGFLLLILKLKCHDWQKVFQPTPLLKTTNTTWTFGLVQNFESRIKPISPKSYDSIRWITRNKKLSFYGLRLAKKWPRYKGKSSSGTQISLWLIHEKENSKIRPPPHLFYCLLKAPHRCVFWPEFILSRFGWCRKNCFNTNTSSMLARVCTQKQSCTLTDDDTLGARHSGHEKVFIHPIICWDLRTTKHSPKRFPRVDCMQGWQQV